MLLAPVLGLVLQLSVQAPGELDSALRTRLQSRLEAFVAAGRVPGVSCGVAASTGEVALAAGRRDRRHEEPLRPDDLLCAGSTGKTFFAALALARVADGKLALDTLAGELLGGEPWFERLPNADALVLSDLLAHRTGLPRYEFQPAFARDLLARPEHVWKPEELLAYVLDHRPAFAAGEGFVYSDTNYILAGMMVERATDAEPYAEIEARFLRPLGLEHVRPQAARRIEGLVQGHAGARDPLGFPDFVLDEAGVFCTNPQFEWAGGGFVTSAGDLARWARALYGGDALPAEQRKSMLAAQPAPELGRGVGYGLGVIVWQTPHGEALGHEGFFPGYMSAMRYWPTHDVAVAVQVNTSEAAALPGGLGALCDELCALVLDP